MFIMVTCKIWFLLLVIDEVHVKDGLIYDKHEGMLVSFTNFDETTNHFLQFEAAIAGDSNSPKLANSMLVFLIRGLFETKLIGDLLTDPV